MNSAEKSLKSKGTITKKVSVPILVWEEWQKDCETHFNNTYYLKMLHDHNFVQSMIGIADAYAQEVEKLHKRIDELEVLIKQTQEKEKEGKKTFG